MINEEIQEQNNVSAITIDEQKLNRIIKKIIQLENDNVETSGIGGIYPKGILIGTIKEIINTKNQTDRYAKVKTATDLDTLQTVLVITPTAGSTLKSNINEDNLLIKSLSPPIILVIISTSLLWNILFNS